MADVVPSAVAADAPVAIQLTSPEFADGEVLAQRYTCDGTDVNPPLQWADVPDGTAELVLVAEDPDHDDGTFVHWMVCGLTPGELGALDEGALPVGATVGVNDYGEATYKGPCPPFGAPARRFVFTLVASGTSLALGERFRARDLVTALDGNVLAKGVLVARYGRTELTGPT
jgi:Raf kinase inhibitor-like YbhB/YbcL family protein